MGCSRAHRGAGGGAAGDLGAADVITLAGRFSASETSATMIGVIAVASSEPRSQNIGTTIAAATAARLEIRRVWSERLPPLRFLLRAHPSTLALHL